MTKQKELMRHKLIEQAIEVVDELLDWQEKNPAAELIDMEEEIRSLRHKLTGIWLKIMVNEQAQEQMMGEQKCAKCGGKMERKGNKMRQISTLVGEIEYEREYCYCQACREGFFPPG